MWFLISQAKTLLHGLLTETHRWMGSRWLMTVMRSLRELPEDSLTYAFRQALLLTCQVLPVFYTLHLRLWNSHSVFVAHITRPTSRRPLPEEGRQASRHWGPESRVMSILEHTGKLEWKGKENINQAPGGREKPTEVAWSEILKDEQMCIKYTGDWKKCTWECVCVRACTGMYV